MIGWPYQTNNEIESSPVVSSPGIVYAGRNQGLDAITLTGRRLWHAPTGVVSGIGVGASGIAYVATQAGRLVAVDQRGRRRWSIGLGASGAIPTVAPGGTIYVGTMKGRFLAIDAHGRIRWSRPLSGDVEAAAALRPGGGVYIGSGLPLLRGSLDPFTAGGRRLWSSHTSSEVFSSPAVGADGTVYCGSGDAHVYALWPSGLLKWRYKAAKVIDSSLAIGPDGTLYIGSDDAFLYAFAPPVRPVRRPIPTRVSRPPVHSKTGAGCALRARSRSGREAGCSRPTCSGTASSRCPQPAGASA